MGRSRFSVRATVRGHILHYAEYLCTSGSFPQVQVSPIYFDREDVKRAIHAPLNVSWEECSDISVFPNGDTSLPSSFTVLPSAIEKSKRSVVIHGLADYILIADGYAALPRHVRAFTDVSGTGLA